MMEDKEHTEEVRQGLERIRNQSNQAIQAALEMMRADKGALFPVDLLALGAVKRHVSTAAAFCTLIEEWNIVSARALLRLQIDTALRFSATWLVDNPHGFAGRVLAGERINRLEDSKGDRLTDQHLVEVRKAELPWLPEVYERLCGYVHLSASHIFASMERSQTVTDGGEVVGYQVDMAIGPRDDKMPESSWMEIIRCFLETSEFLLRYLRGWTETKTQRPTPESHLPDLPAGPRARTEETG
jgi:hypothetical protein